MSEPLQKTLPVQYDRGARRLTGCRGVDDFRVRHSLLCLAFERKRGKIPIQTSIRWCFARNRQTFLI